MYLRTMSHEVRSDAVKVFQSDGKNSPTVMLLSLKVSSLSPLTLLFALH